MKKNIYIYNIYKLIKRFGRITQLNIGQRAGYVHIKFSNF